MTQTAELSRTTEAPPSRALAMMPTPIEDFVILDNHSETGTARIEAQPRVNSIATVSGGFRDDQNRPQRTKAGEMFVHGEAPGLLAALQRTDNKSLTVMFPSDDARDFIQQRFTQHSASALLAYGDENQITLIDKNNRREFKSGTPEYKAAIANCKISYSVYFSLAEWTQDGCDMVFPDGFGLYRLRFTSMNSLRSILASVQHMKRTTGGKIAGIPFDLFLRQQEHTDSGGQKRQVWIWQCVPRPPHGMRFSVPMFRRIIESGQEQRKMLQLEAPAPETLETAALETPDIDLDDASLESLQNPPCDFNYWNERWHATVKDSIFADADTRHACITAFTGGITGSLSAFLKTASEQDARELVETVSGDIHKGLIADWDELVKEAKTLDIQTRDLPPRDFDVMRAWIDSLGNAIKRNRAKKLEDAGPIIEGEVEETVPDAASTREDAAPVETPQMAGDFAPLAEAARGVRESAQSAKNAVKAARANVQTAAAPVEKLEAPDGWPAHITNLFDAAQAQSLNVSEFLHSQAVLDGVNRVVTGILKRAAVEQMLDLDSGTATLLLPQIANGNLKW